MVTHSMTAYFIVGWLLVVVSGCAPTVAPVNPPEGYKGPVAESPLVQNGDYWVYQRANTTRGKTSALVANLGFPLWIGKTWTYDGEALLWGQPQTSKAFRTPTHIDCYVAGFNQITVTAGTFNAFQCECQCNVINTGYDSLCGVWTIWYAPDVKNVIRQKSEKTESTFELVEYKLARPNPAAKTSSK